MDPLVSGNGQRLVSPGSVVEVDPRLARQVVAVVQGMLEQVIPQVINEAIGHTLRVLEQTEGAAAPARAVYRPGIEFEPAPWVVDAAADAASLVAGD